MLIQACIPSIPASLVAGLVLSAGSAIAQIQPVNFESAGQIAGPLREVNFEQFSFDFVNGLPGQPALANPLSLAGMTVTDPFTLQGGFCSTPTCRLDPDNSSGGNNVLFLNRGGSLSFALPPLVVVLDIQGMGSNPFTVSVTDSNGHRASLAGTGVLFGETLLGMTSANGINRIEVESVGGTGGPLVLTRVLISDVPEPSTTVLAGAGALLLAAWFARSRRLI
jgi:hypothetical protein